MINITNNERKLYNNPTKKTQFETPEEEVEWAATQLKKCSKCEEHKPLTEFAGNTSGADAFDRNGYRLRRPECKCCGKKASNGKSMAMKYAKENKIAYKAPEGTLCHICNKPEKDGDKLVFDHCHKKNIFRGYCHNSCNRSLGVLGDDIDGLLNAMNYLLKLEKCKIIQKEDGTLMRVIE